MIFFVSAWFVLNYQLDILKMCSLQFLPSSSLLKMWTNLPLDLKRSNSLSIFKNRLLNSLFENYITMCYKPNSVHKYIYFSNKLYILSYLMTGIYMYIVYSPNTWRQTASSSVLFNSPWETSCTTSKLTNYGKLERGTNLCQKLKFSNYDIFASWFWNPLIF